MKDNKFKELGKIKKLNKNRKKECFSKEKVIQEIQQESKVLNLHTGAVNMIAEEVAKKIQNWVQDKPTITQADLDRRIVEEVKKYNKDLAFILNERTKLI